MPAVRRLGHVNLMNCRAGFIFQPRKVPDQGPAQRISMIEWQSPALDREYQIYNIFR